MDKCHSIWPWYFSLKGHVLHFECIKHIAYHSIIKWNIYKVVNFRFIDQVSLSRRTTKTYNFICNVGFRWNGIEFFDGIFRYVMYKTMAKCIDDELSTKNGEELLWLWMSDLWLLCSSNLSNFQLIWNIFSSRQSV